MASKKPFYFLVALLLSLGIGSSIYRHVVDGIPLVPGAQTTNWTVEARVAFQANGQPIEVSLALPEDPGFEILSESAASPGYGLTVARQQQARRAVWTKREAMGQQELYFTANLVASGRSDLTESVPPQEPLAETWAEGVDTAAQALIDLAWSRSASNLSYAQQIAKMLSETEQAQNVALLLSHYKPEELMVQLLHSAKIPARVGHGLRLEDGRRRQSLVPIVEVYDNGLWHLFDPLTGTSGREENMLLWQRSSASVLDITGAANSTVTFSIIRDTRPAMATALDMMTAKGLASFSLYSLPLEEQSLIRGLMLVPIGVLVVVFLRVLVGLKTSGTFMPVLIALAFIQTTLLTGLVGFLLIVAVGLYIRGYLSNLNLLLISRISAVVIVVLGIIAGFTVLAYNLGLTEGLTITFFPMIILAWTIERMSILWEEEGPKEVAIQGGGSLLVATITYLCMVAPLVQHWVFNFLGIHLVILAGVLMMGQYTGYRLLELRRFKPLAGDD
ncbi:Inactive transglutaminase fused to 7 transmembrane helices [Ferrimonas sediminum]|uniref:Inactive transglutaminase fused to 7 transmembrane helices n=1 Tax=Ferrimonas sediminum TaxID=718193 RepID=A0A1G8VJR2_9GAMM|nr:inactive transglutaminase family protein [Ferrimonas sediminum]SDJ65555.1 Inactive transglutaminase fused to 7 transmembrane helices [Ferrimonas sediminum]